MPLIKYFGFVGSALVLLLLGLGWCFPQPVTESLASAVDGPTIRIASLEKLPERVVIDTSLPTIIPPPTVLDFVERWPQATVAVVSPIANPATPAPVSEAPKKQQNAAKREPSKKVAVHRAAPKVNTASASNDTVQASPAETRLSLLDILKDGLGHTQAKLMAGLEPLATYVSKPRSGLP